ncbi:HemK/PrmC family methyltransferase [Helicobacter monodelphidis]|uniref:HemK/PrmC family methyltransferase n=1 Tax=Helicobacter sp. 15-1451 TaxID=2004995 RepID=UPI0015EBAA04|nr:HemK/PrmC family methyltransferase [Helicobacter sp. 15-1451]
MQLQEILKKGTSQLRNIAERPLLESEILLSFILQKNRVFLHTHPNLILTNSQIRAIHKLFKRRENGEPIEYITHSVSFMEYFFYITKGALIPRPESEILIEKTKSLILQTNAKNVAEIGVGSGALICSLSLSCPNIQFFGNDISLKALRIATINIKRHSLQKRITLNQSSLLDKIPQNIEIIYSNPPYIQNNIPLPKPVLYEPKEALFGGEMGDEILKQIIFLTHQRKIPYLLCEMGYNQRESIEAYVQQFTPKKITFYQDLAGLERGFIIEFGG